MVSGTRAGGRQFYRLAGHGQNIGVHGRNTSLGLAPRAAILIESRKACYQRCTATIPLTMSSIRISHVRKTGRSSGIN